MNGSGRYTGSAESAGPTFAEGQTRDWDDGARQHILRKTSSRLVVEIGRHLLGLGVVEYAWTPQGNSILIVPGCTDESDQLRWRRI